MPHSISRGHRILSHVSHCYHQRIHFHKVTLRWSCPVLDFLLHKELRATKPPHHDPVRKAISKTCYNSLAAAPSKTNVSCLFKREVSTCRRNEQNSCQPRLSINKGHVLQPLSGCEFSTTSQHFEEAKPKPKAENGNEVREQTEENPNKEEKLQYKNWRTLLTVPNLLTATRIALTPYLGYLVVSGSYEYACGLFLFAGVTDLLDGWIARRFPSQSSPVGSFMDPLADKFLVSTLFITLTVANLIPVPLTCLVVARDISLIAAAFYVRIISLPPPITLLAVFDVSNQTAELKPTLISKANTAIQLGLIVSTLAAPVFNYVDHAALQALWFLTAGTTLWSGIGYVFAKDTFKVFKQRRLMKKQ